MPVSKDYKETLAAIEHCLNFEVNEVGVCGGFVFEEDLKNCREALLVAIEVEAFNESDT